MKRVNVGGYGYREQVFIAEETIGARCSVVITNTDQDKTVGHIKQGTTLLDYAGIGISVAGALSGQPCRVVTNGFVSGVYLGGAVGAGDGLACCNNTSGGAASGNGRLIGVKTTTPAGSIATSAVVTVTPSIAGTYGASGYMTSAVVTATAVGILSAAIVGTAVNTARIIAKALASGGFGSAIPVMVIGVA